MNALAIRKRLLVAESELNRAQLVGELVALKSGVRTLSQAATSWRAIIPSSAVVALGLVCFRYSQVAATAVQLWRARSMRKENVAKPPSTRDRRCAP